MPGFSVVNSSEFPDSNPLLKFPFNVKPDVSIYAGKASVPTDLSSAEIFIEFKRQAKDDPFCDVDNNHKTIICSSKNANDTLGQITAYAAVQLAAQFRTHAYSVFILGCNARILHWDRSGTIVMEAFEFSKSPYLVDFFHRYSGTTDKMRGKDGTVLMPTTAEQYKARRTLKLDQNVTLHKLSIPFSVSNDDLLYFITCPPEPTLYAPPGHATCGFKAYDVACDQVVFLKDSWRIVLPGITLEGDVYKALNNAGVQHIPKCLAWGDICTGYHSTETHKFTHAEWAHHSNNTTHFLHHQHCHLVLDIVRVTLIEYQSSDKMVSAVRNGLVSEGSKATAGPC